MNLSNLYANHIGLVHLIFSLLAVFFGTVVLIMKKGSKTHRYMGYVYTISMVILLITAFMIYGLYGKFGIFHWLAVLSTITLLGGIVPMIIKKPAGYISVHFNFMFWSVFGLYAAFAAEILVRIPKVVTNSGVPNDVFYNMVGLAVFLVMGLAYFVMYKKREVWSKFDKSNSSSEKG